MLNGETTEHYSDIDALGIVLFQRSMAMIKIHLDTDIGGDMDDLCALAMLLKWPDLEITGVTTVSEEQGRQAIAAPIHPLQSCLVGEKTTMN